MNRLEAWRKARAEAFSDETVNPCAPIGHAVNAYLAGMEAEHEVAFLMGKIEGHAVAAGELHTIDSSDSSHDTIDSCAERINLSRLGFEAQLAELLKRGEEK